MKSKFSKILLIITILLMPIIIFSSGLLDKKVDKTIIHEKAKVLSINEEKLKEDSDIPGLSLGYQQIKVEILTGAFKGEVYNIKNSLSRLYNVHTKEGMEVILRIKLKDNNISDIVVFNYKRDGIIYSLVALFFIVLIVFGGFKGLKSVVSLIFTAVMVIFFMLPLFFKGYDPIFITILTISIVTIISLSMLNGWNRKTLSAILGTIIGVIIAGIISYTAGNLAHLSGITMNEAEELIYLAGDRGLKVKGLMFSAILIASLGAIMDVAMSISSSVFEIHSVDSNLSRKDLFASGMNVGKDVMGTMSNTLILAFTGGSLNIMILIMAYEMSYRQLINLDLIGIELIQGLAGSIGIVLTVPITALISVVLLTKQTTKSYFKN